MNFNIDSAIFIAFLVATIIVGLYSSRGSHTIRQYAIGERNFSTATIVATIVATWISGSFFYTHTSEIYTNGLYFMWVSVLGDFLSLFLIGVIFTPRMGEFLGKLSIAEAMGGLYGKRVRVITAVASFIGTAGLIAIQLKLAGLIFEYALNIPYSYGVLIATVIVTLYSSLGGIKAVTFTDIIQFFTFGFAIPLTAYTLLTTIDNLDVVTNTITNNPLFDYREVFDFTNPLALKHLFLFLLCMTPSFSPQYFQRIAIARNTRQAGKAFILAAVTCLFLAVMIDWIGVLVLSKDGTLGSNDVVKYIIFNSSYVGLKGIMLAGVMAMIMSTVDSCINSTAVIIVHDFFKPLKVAFASNEILSARIVSALIGIASLALSLHEGSLLELFMMTTSFYMAVVSAPFIMAVLGFRSTEKSVISGMVAGLVTIIIWDYLLRIEAVNSVPIGMLANFIFLTGSHYLLKQAGGWVGIKDPAPLIAIQNERRQRFQNLIADIKSFNLLNTLQKNSPKGEGLISILGFFVMISAFSSTHTLPKEYQAHYSYLLDILYPITLCSSSALISYPLWLQSWKETRLLGVCWNIIMFFILISFSFLMVLISNFSEIQLMAFMVNIILVSSLVTWRWALVTITIGVAITASYYQNYIHVEIEESLITSQFKIVYLLLLVSSTLITFFKPKQEYQELTEEQNNHLQVMIKDREEELGKAQELKHEFLRNLEHEVNAPLVGLTSLAPMVLEDFDRLSPQQMKKYVKSIVDSHERYKTLSDNLLDLSKLNSMKYKLSRVTLNLSELVKIRLDYCRRLYLGNKELGFAMEIDPDVIIEGDEHYITSAIDNLIINAINYSSNGTITLKLSRKTDSTVEFQITDEGIGIPKSELYKIFGAFVVSSKTRTPSGGRGIGLALCKKVAEVHGGSIRADSDGEKGAAFILELPV